MLSKWPETDVQVQTVEHCFFKKLDIGHSYLLFLTDY